MSKLPQHDQTKRNEGGVTVEITDEVYKRMLFQMEALKSVIAVLAAKAEVSDEEVMTLLDVALAEELAE